LTKQYTVCGEICHSRNFQNFCSLAETRQWSVIGISVNGKLHYCSKVWGL